MLNDAYFFVACISDKRHFNNRWFTPVLYQEMDWDQFDLNPKVIAALKKGNLICHSLTNGSATIVSSLHNGVFVGVSI